MDSKRSTDRKRQRVDSDVGAKAFRLLDLPGQITSYACQFLNVVDHLGVARACKVLHKAGSSRTSWNFRKLVVHYVYGTNGAQCDWRLAERLLNYSKRFDEEASLADARDTNAAWGLLIAERCSWHRPHGSVLFDRAAELWSKLPEEDYFAHLWRGYMIWADDELSSAEVRQEAGEQVLKLIPRLERRVELGDQVAMMWLGQLHHVGCGVNKDPERRLQLWRQAVALGLAAGEFRIGLADCPEMKEWTSSKKLENALRRNYPRGMHDYACELERSQQPSELKEAFRIFEQASLHGLCISHNKCGWMYEDGLGVTKDTDMSMYYIMQSADCGNASAMYYLGTTLWRKHNNKMPEAEGKQILELYHKAALLGHRESMRWLPVCYERGIGTKPDRVKAKELMRKYKAFIGEEEEEAVAAEE